MPRVGRVALVAAATLVLLAGGAAPAAAHGRGSDATSYASRIIDEPAIEGLEWRIYGGDELLWVDNRTGDEIVVLGYEGEPYLRVGPDGVFENRRSPATYVNQDRYAGVRVPDSADPDAEPAWARVSGQPRYAWHDHRIHWMSPGLAPQITDPGERTHVQDWTVLFRVEGEERALHGELEWIPGPSPWPWLALGLLLTLPALAGLRSEPVEGRWPGLARPAGVVLGVIVAANVVFLVDDLFAVPVGVTTRLLAAAQTALFLAVGAFGAVRARQAGDGAFTALGVGAGALLVGQGLLLWSVLSASQLSTLFPDALPRLLVGVNIAQALTLGAVAFIGTQRLLPDLEDLEEADQPSTAPASPPSV